MDCWRWIALGIVATVGTAGACRAPSAPSPAGSVDVLDYLVGDAMLWPRVGSHSQNQVVDYSRREVCWVKYANPRTFECWRWDDQYVYHAVDHGIDNNTGESYSIVDARWLPRQLRSEWRLDVSTRIVWFDPLCHIQADRSGPFRYHQRAWIEPRVDGGGDVGARETLVLEYAPEDPAGGPTSVETFYFGRGAGWYEWRRGPIRDVFNRVGGPSPSVARGVICQMDALGFQGTVRFRDPHADLSPERESADKRLDGGHTDTGAGRLLRNSPDQPECRAGDGPSCVPAPRAAIPPGQS